MSYDHDRSECLYPKGCSGCPSDDECVAVALYANAWIAAIDAEMARLLLLREVYRRHIETLTQALRHR